MEKMSHIDRARLEHNPTHRRVRAIGIIIIVLLVIFV